MAESCDLARVGRHRPAVAQASPVPDSRSGRVQLHVAGVWRRSHLGQAGTTTARRRSIPAATDADQPRRRSGRSPRHLDEQERRTDAADGGHDPGIAATGRYARQEAGDDDTASLHWLCRQPPMPHAGRTGHHAVSDLPPPPGPPPAAGLPNRKPGELDVAMDLQILHGHPASPRSRSAMPAWPYRSQGAKPTQKRGTQLCPLGIVLPGGLARWPRCADRRSSAKQSPSGADAGAGQRLPAQSLPLQDQGMSGAGGQSRRYQFGTCLYPAGIALLRSP
jgi:hypothetical protein